MFLQYGIPCTGQRRDYDMESSQPLPLHPPFPNALTVAISNDDLFNIPCLGIAVLELHRSCPHDNILHQIGELVEEIAITPLVTLSDCSGSFTHKWRHDIPPRPLLQCILPRCILGQYVKDRLHKVRLTLEAKGEDVGWHTSSFKR